jgi:hypothetical protein
MASGVLPAQYHGSFGCFVMAGSMALLGRTGRIVRRSRRQQLWGRLAAGDLRNVGFAEFRRLIESFGFRLRRVSGSHYIYKHPSPIKFLNFSRWFGNSA